MSKFLCDHNENTEGRGWRLLGLVFWFSFFSAQIDVGKEKKKNEMCVGV
jgi:hypothetical protein